MGWTDWIVRNVVSPAVATIASLVAVGLYERWARGGFDLPLWGLALAGGMGYWS